MKGILLLDKPVGWTSFDVVKYVRKMVSEASSMPIKQTKVGHSGTLDPFATGLLILLIGKEYTKKAELLLKQPKTYEFKIKLGYSSTTGDTEGQITDFSAEKPSPEKVEGVITKFIGEYLQTPPEYSAIKVDGRKSYDLARAGVAIKHQPRPITIHSLVKSSYKYPYLDLITDVSSGTYIRVLSEDIAKALGTKGYTKELRRTKVGNYNVADALKVDELKTNSIENYLIH